MVTENVATGQETNVPPVTEQAPVESPATQEQPQGIDGWMQKKGFKEVGEVARSYDESQAAFTRVSQEKAQLEQALRDLSQVRPQVQQPQAPDFFDDPESNVKRIAENAAARVFETRQAGQVIETVRSENVEKFEELRPLLKQIYIDKPWLNNQGVTGLRTAMKEAEKMRDGYIDTLWGELEKRKQRQTGQPSPNEEEIRQKVIDEIARNKGAMIPAGDSSRSFSSDTGKKQKEAASKGDVDGVLNEMFKNIKV